MRSPFKRSGRGQCQGSRLKITPGCKTECAFLLLLLLALTSVINNGQRESKLIKLVLHFGVMGVMLKQVDTFQNIGKADGRNPFLNIPSRRLPRKQVVCPTSQAWAVATFCNDKRLSHLSPVLEVVDLK